MPDHPGERPTKVAHKKWATLWRAKLSQIGYSAVLRGDVPHDVKKLMDRSLIADPSGSNASIAAENARITHQNASSLTAIFFGSTFRTGFPHPPGAWGRVFLGQNTHGERKKIVPHPPCL